MVQNGDIIGRFLKSSFHKFGFEGLRRIQAYEINYEKGHLIVIERTRMDEHKTTN